MRPGDISSKCENLENGNNKKVTPFIIMSTMLVKRERTPGEWIRRALILLQTLILLQVVNTSRLNQDIVKTGGRVQNIFESIDITLFPPKKYALLV